MKTLPVLSVALLSTLSALQEKPWYGDAYEFQFAAGYTYDRWRTIQGASVQPPGVSNDHLLFGGITAALDGPLQAEFEAEFADTPRQRFGWRSFAGQVRYRLLDDIAGDFISLTTGLNFRYVSMRSLRDVSCPHSNRCNWELNASAGKEWSSEGMWTLRGYLFTSGGLGSNGKLWTRVNGLFGFHWVDRHQLKAFINTFWGFGGQRAVDTNTFYGWGRTHHESVDLGVAYTYETDFWGCFTVAYARRVFARTFPENVNFVTIRYDLPFSLF